MLSGGMTGLRIGSYVLDRHFWRGDIAEVIVFEGELSAAERTAIEDVLMDRWGVDPVPEPGTLVLLATMAMLLLWQRKR